MLGRRIDDLPEPALVAIRRQVPFVLEGSALLDGVDLLHNVMLGARSAGASPREARSRAAALLERVGLADAAGRVPAQVGPGVLMRATVARALALSPRMIVYDGPKSGLEPAAARRFDVLLLELRAQGVGALAISHDLPLIPHVRDEAHLLHEGRIHLAGRRARSWKVPTRRATVHR